MKKDSQRSDCAGKTGEQDRRDGTSDPTPASPAEATVSISELSMHVSKVLNLATQRRQTICISNRGVVTHKLVPVEPLANAKSGRDPRLEQIVQGAIRDVTEGAP